MDSKGRFIAPILFLWFTGICHTQTFTAKVDLIRTPNDGIQPQALVDKQGVVHLIYFKGNPEAGDIFYVQWDHEKNAFSQPRRVNSLPGSAVAVGTIRGAQMALGKTCRVHVVWNGSFKAMPRGQLDPGQPKDAKQNGMPLLYARMNDTGYEFEIQRNLAQFTFGLDGGGTVAADEQGNVFVAWNGLDGLSKKKGDEGRNVWIKISKDEGKTFAREKRANPEITGASGCCSLRAWVDQKSRLYLLYKSAIKNIYRNQYLLISKNRGAGFKSIRLDQWMVEDCPMSGASFSEGPDYIQAAWENYGQIYFTRFDPLTYTVINPPLSAPDTGVNRKYPCLATNSQLETILVWIEGIPGQKGGNLAWQIYNKAGQPTADKGLIQGVPVWSLATAFVRPDDGFTIVY